MMRRRSAGSAPAANLDSRPLGTGLCVSILVEAADDPRESGHRLANAVALARRVPEAAVWIVPEGDEPARYYETTETIIVPENVRRLDPDQGRMFIDRSPEPDTAMRALRLEFPAVPPCPICGAERWPSDVRFAARERVEVHYACPRARDTAHYRPAELTVVGRAMSAARDGAGEEASDARG
jgi:hypothetical protein